MNSHELAKILLEKPCCAIKASVDMSTCDNNSENRVFGSFYDIQPESDGSVTFLFESGYANYQGKGEHEPA